MSDTDLGEILARLAAAIDQFTQSAALASTARDQVRDAHRKWRRAGEGSRNPALRHAVHNAAAADTRVDALPSLFHRAAEALTRYLDDLGAASGPGASGTLPGGEELADAEPATALAALTRRTVQSADDVQDAATSLAKFVERGRHVSVGTATSPAVLTSTSHPVVTAAPAPGPMEAADLLAGAGIAVVVAAGRLAGLVRTMWRRHQNGSEHANS